MYSIDALWKKRYCGVKLPDESKIQGWTSRHNQVSGFVEPRVRLTSGDVDGTRIFILSAPGAVGKSTLARAIASQCQTVLIDLSQTTPMGGNFFKGGLANAFGYDALPKAAQGEIGLIVDGLDEGQLRASASGYEAALLDLADIVIQERARPVILLGRSLAAEDAALIFNVNGYKVCEIVIEFFDDSESKAYIESKCDILSRKSQGVQDAYHKHRDSFREFALETRRELMNLKDGADQRFSGYAPVLDAICEFALDDDRLNPASRRAKLSGETPVELVTAISEAILDREQGKLVAQVRAKFPSYDPALIATLYDKSEQRLRLISKILGTSEPTLPDINNSEIRQSYMDMVRQFMGQHPFLDAKQSGPANLVFSADLMLWALSNKLTAEAARSALSRDSKYHAGILFDMYMRNLDQNSPKHIPLSDAGFLYFSLQSKLESGRKASLEIMATDEAGKDISISFEVLDSSSEDPLLASYGPFRTASESVLELNGPFSHVNINAPIWIFLGNGETQAIGAPTDIHVETLSINARQLFVHGPADRKPDDVMPEVLLSASEVSAPAVRDIAVRGTVFSILWPEPLYHPWTNYAIKPVAAKSEKIDFLRRRLRKILTAFRSHKRGTLVRFAPKIDSLRMVKNKAGADLVAKLVSDGILTLIDGGKSYELSVERMAEFLNIDYLSLQKHRYTDQVDSYLSSIDV